MSYKTGYKAIWKPSEYDDAFTVYVGNESVSDIDCFKVYKNDKEIDILEHYEDPLSKGRESLIDVLYYLKHRGPGTYKFDYEHQDITIEPLSYDEMNKIFG